MLLLPRRNLLLIPPVVQVNLTTPTFLGVFLHFLFFFLFTENVSKWSDQELLEKKFVYGREDNIAFMIWDLKQKRNIPQGWDLESSPLIKQDCHVSLYQTARQRYYAKHCPHCNTGRCDLYIYCMNSVLTETIMYSLAYSTWKKSFKWDWQSFIHYSAATINTTWCIPNKGDAIFLQCLPYQLAAQKKVAIYFPVRTHYHIIVVDEGSNGVRNSCQLGIQQECLADVYKWKSFNRCYLYFFNDIILCKRKFSLWIAAWFDQVKSVNWDVQKREHFIVNIQ